MRAGVYARISLDSSGEAAGVKRQLEDCRALAAGKGWDVVAEWVDNDVSATRSRKRPGFDAMLAACEAGEIDVVVAWHTDRLYRRLTDLERLTDALKVGNVEVSTVGSGDLDLSTPTGRMLAGILGSVARGEAEHMGERVSRAKRSLADQGRPAGGGKRPFGFLEDRVSLHPVEAPLLAEVARQLDDGGTFGEAVRWLTKQGSVTTWGRPWTVGALRRTITSARYAGLRSYKGEVVGDAVWSAIIDRDVWERIRDGVHARRRGGRPATAPYLLRGHLQCGKCGGRMYGSSSRSGRLVYSCPVNPRSTGVGCGSSILGQPVEELVLAALAAAVDDVDAGRVALHASDRSVPAKIAKARAELEDTERRLTSLASRWGSGKLTDGEYDAARVAIVERQARARVVLAGRAAPVATWAVHLTELRTALSDRVANVDLLRGAVGALLVTPIVVGAGKTEAGARVLPANRVQVASRWG